MVSRQNTTSVDSSYLFTTLRRYRRCGETQAGTFEGYRTILPGLQDAPRKEEEYHRIQQCTSEQGRRKKERKGYLQTLIDNLPLQAYATQLVYETHEYWYALVNGTSSKDSIHT